MIPKNIMLFFRRMSNCSDAEPQRKRANTTVTSSTEGEQQTAGDDSVQGPEDEVVVPPDNLLAREMAEVPEDLEAIPSAVDAMKAVTTGIHLQETRKPHMTPAARQWEALTSSMINYINKVNTQEKEEDNELDLSFAGLAQQMRLHLDKIQRQRVLNRVNHVVGDCIENVLLGIPLFGAPPLPQPQPNYAPQMSNIMPTTQNIPSQRPNAAGGDNIGFYNSIQYPGDNELSYTQM